MAEIKLSLGGKSPTVNPEAGDGWREATELEQANCWGVYADSRVEGEDTVTIDAKRYKLFGPEEMRTFRMSTAEADAIGKLFVELDGMRLPARMSEDRTLWVKGSGFSGL